MKYFFLFLISFSLLAQVNYINYPGGGGGNPDAVLNHGLSRDESVAR